MEPSTSTNNCDEHSSVTIHDLSENDENHELQEDDTYSEDDAFIPVTLCPKTPDSKAFDKLHDLFEKQCSSTPLAIPRTPRLGKISEEDISIVSSLSTGEFSENPSMSKSEKKSRFHVILALAVLMFMIGFGCGFYLSFPIKVSQETKEIMIQMTVSNVLFQGGVTSTAEQSYTLGDASESATVSNGDDVLFQSGVTSTAVQEQSYTLGDVTESATVSNGDNVLFQGGVTSTAVQEQSYTSGDVTESATVSNGNALFQGGVTSTPVQKQSYTYTELATEDV
ncbi:uncharacterized protein [Antedon mediterranea]|uniref:uncharacterized protein isoform X1 n=1 Tax=Antedon mediterranea TaxID=105859 RepID=UPI003AF72BD8